MEKKLRFVRGGRRDPPGKSICASCWNRTATRCGLFALDRYRFETGYFDLRYYGAGSV